MSSSDMFQELLAAENGEDLSAKVAKIHDEMRVEAAYERSANFLTMALDVTASGSGDYESADRTEESEGEASTQSTVGSDGGQASGDTPATAVAHSVEDVKAPADREPMLVTEAGEGSCSACGRKGQLVRVGILRVCKDLEQCDAVTVE